MQLYLSVAPGESAGHTISGVSLAHAAYRIGADSTLLRQNLLLQTRDGLMALSDREAPPIADPARLCAAILRECSRRSYQGVLLDPENAFRRDFLSLAQHLAPRLRENRRTLFLPERYAAPVPQAVPLICTALSGGVLNQRLTEAAAAFSGRKTALDVQRLRMDFSLPARSGEGRPLTAEALRLLVEQHHPSIFFSQSLCTRYFTYTRDQTAHFVLFDDADTLRRKLQAGAQLGYCAAFFQWPEISDIATQLFPQAKRQPSAP